MTTKLEALICSLFRSDLLNKKMLAELVEAEIANRVSTWWLRHQQADKEKK